jgi:hypothetical protein
MLVSTTNTNLVLLSSLSPEADIFLTTLADALNVGVYTWTIGETDNINDEQISNNSNFVLEITDPSGKTGTGNGFIDGTLQSRGFRIKSGVTPSSSSISSSSTSSISASGLSKGAKAGIGIGVFIGAVALIAIGAGLATFFTRRRNSQKNSRAGIALSSADPIEESSRPEVPQTAPVSPYSAMYLHTHYIELSGESSVER